LPSTQQGGFRVSATDAGWLLPRLLEWIGAPPRRGAQVALATAALAFGVVTEAMRFSTWRHQTVSEEFRRELRQSLGKGLLTVLMAAVLVGLGAVYQAISWLAFLGQEDLAGRILVTVLMRETTPVLVGVILLGRSGTVTVVEFGAIKATGQIRLLEAQGIDPFLLLVLPRVLALAVAGFTLGVIFLLVSVGVGWLTAEMLGLLHGGQADFLDNIIEATQRRDYAVFAAKMTLIGALVALTSAITGMSATTRDTPSFLLPRGFVRGLTAILLTSILLSVSVI